MTKTSPWPATSLNKPLISLVQHLDLVWFLRPKPNDSFKVSTDALTTTVLPLERVCVALRAVGTGLKSLSIKIGHMPNMLFCHRGIYPLWSAEPDVFAPLKELRVRRVSFVVNTRGPNQGAVNAYLNSVKEVMEGHCTPSFPTVELKLLMYRELFSYTSALQVGPWHPWFSGCRDKLEEAVLRLDYPADENPERLVEVDLISVLALLEDVFRERSLEWKEFGLSMPPKKKLQNRGIGP